MTFFCVALHIFYIEDSSTLNIQVNKNLLAYGIKVLFVFCDTKSVHTKSHSDLLRSLGSLIHIPINQPEF